MGDKLSIAEARARRSDPVWRRRHKVADITAAVLVALLLLLPPAVVALWPPVGAALVAALLVGAAAGLWWRGPKVGLERRTALVVPIPVLDLVVLVPAVWRAAHLHLQHWQGPLEPSWDDTTWRLVGGVAVVAWAATFAALVLSLT